MINEAPNVQRARALHRHLSENESDLIRRNIVVRVDSINTGQNVALCTVEQRITGLLRRTYSPPELVWRAEQALAPLIGLGIMPLITVRHPALQNAKGTAQRATGRSLMDWVPNVWSWLGYPLAPRGFGAVRLDHDPFGWRGAMLAPVRI